MIIAIFCFPVHIICLLKVINDHCDREQCVLYFENQYLFKIIPSTSCIFPIRSYAEATILCSSDIYWWKKYASLNMSYKTAVVTISRALNMHFVFKWQQVFSVVCNRPLTWCFFFVSWERPLCKVKLPHSGLLCRSLIMEDQCHNHVTSLYIHVHFILHCWGKKIWHLYIIIVLCTYIHGYLLS